jgi:hypothetical protein
MLIIIFLKVHRKKYGRILIYVNKDKKKKNKNKIMKYMIKYISI